MVLAELNIRHTRRHSRPGASRIGDGYLPTERPGATARSLLGAVVAEHLRRPRRGAARARCRGSWPTARDGLVGAADRAALPAPDRPARPRPLPAPHRRRGRAGRRRARPSTARPTPQVIGAVMAAAALPSSARRTAVPRHRRRARAARGSSPRGSRCGGSSRASPACSPTRRRGPDSRRGPVGAGSDGATATPTRRGRACRPSAGGRWRCSACAPACGVDRADVQAPVPPAGPPRPPRPRRSATSARPSASPSCPRPASSSSGDRLGRVTDR